MELELPSFEAYLRALVEHHRYVKVQYFTELRELITRNALVVKVDEESTGSMVVLSTGERFLLSRLVSVDGWFAPTYAGYAPYCETCDC